MSRALVLPPGTPRRLAALRLLTGLYMGEHLWRRRRMLRRVAASDPALFAPVGPARLLREPVDPEAYRRLLLATQVLNGAYVLGAGHRLTGPLYGASLMSVLAYRNSFGMIYHTDHLPALHILALGLAPAADALSADALLRRRRPARPAWRYGGPVRLMNGVTVLTYALAGVAKVKGPLGFRWAGGEALRSQIAVDGLRKELMGDGAAPLTPRLFTDPRAVLALRALAAGSLVVELGAPAALAGPRAARLFALNALGMHWGIKATMRISFRYQLCGIAFAPLVLEQAGPRPAGPGTRAAAALGLAALAVVASPVREHWRAAPRDGFPLSPYPMFTARRRKRIRETHLVGITADGERRNLHYKLAGSGGLNLVRRQIRRLAAEGRGEEVCARAAAALVRTEAHPDVVEVRLVTSHFRLADFFGGDREPCKERVRAAAPVARPVVVPA